MQWSPHDPAPANRMIEVRDVTVRFGPRVALDAGSLRFGAGTSVALVGPNGSGKTTLLRLLAGLADPTTGSVGRAAGTHVAYVAQHQHQHRWMPLTVDEVLRMSRYGRRGLLGPLRRDDKEAIAVAAGRLDVTDLRHRRFGELSGGQRQRVLVASALATRADAVLLDEPITGLDLPSQHRILDVIVEERDAGRLVVLSTHDLDEARQCDRIVLLAGRVVADGPPPEVLTRGFLSEAFGSHLVDDARTLQVIDDHGHGSHG